jgi:hypothetical protein
MKDTKSPGVKQENVFLQLRFGDNNTDFDVPYTTKSGMSFGIRETLAGVICDESKDEYCSDPPQRCLCLERTRPSNSSTVFWLVSRGSVHCSDKGRASEGDT